MSGAWQNLLEIEKLRGPKGEKPIFEKRNGCLMMKYEGQPDSAFVNIFDREELKMKFSDLTPAEVDLLKLHFADLTEEDIIALQKPATDAAARVDEKMVQISQDVNQIIKETTEVKNAAVTATENAGKATDAAITAVGLVGTAIENANVATDLATDAAELAEQKAGLANTAAGVADVATEKANTAAGKADTATDNAEKATVRLDALSDHRDEIRDGYWWRWNETTKEYEKTTSRADGNILFASVELDPVTGELSVITPDGYDGLTFELDNRGYLSVIV